MMNIPVRMNIRVRINIPARIINPDKDDELSDGTKILLLCLSNVLCDRPLIGYLLGAKLPLCTFSKYVGFQQAWGVKFQLDFKIGVFFAI